MTTRETTQTLIRKGALSMLSGQAVKLWVTLVSFGGHRPFLISTHNLKELLATSECAIRRYRNELKQAGVISYYPQGSSRPTLYVVRRFNDVPQIMSYILGRQLETRLSANGAICEVLEDGAAVDKYFGLSECGQNATLKG